MVRTGHSWVGEGGGGGGEMEEMEEMEEEMCRRKRKDLYEGKEIKKE